MSETNLITMMTGLLGISKDFASEIVTDARKGLEASVHRETNNLSNQFKNVLGSDLGSDKTTESIKVMQKTQGGKWILTNLFEKNDTPEQRFSKFRQSTQRGEQLYLVSNAKANPTKINVINKNISLGDSVERFDLATPKEPSGFQKALHSLTRGLLFNSAIKRYEEQKEAMEKQSVINAFIDKHKVVVEQSKRDARSKEGQSLLKEMLAKSFDQRTETQKAPQVKENISKEEISRRF